MKNKLVNWGISLFVLWAFSMPMTAQENQEEKQEAAPLELPNFVIEREEEFNMSIGAKEKPKSPQALNADYLDSLNSFEKQTVIPISPENFPNTVFDNSYKHGFLRADLGRFMTADIEAGYGFNIAGYELYANAGVDMSNGHTDNSDYFNAHGKVSSDFIAPMKYFLFGGSRTRTSVEFGAMSYSLYGSENQDFISNGNFDRDVYDLDLNIHSDGNYEGVQFQTGAGFQTLNVLSKKNDVSENSLQAYLKAQKYWHNFYLGGNLDFDIATLGGDGVTFIQADGSAKYMSSKFSINATAGFQYAGTTLKDDRGGFLLAGDMEFRANDMVSIFGNFRSGLNKKKFSDFFAENRYIAVRSDIDYTYDIADLYFGVMYHPTVRTGISGKIGYKAAKRFAFFTDNIDEWNVGTTGEFGIGYADVSGMQFELESWLQMTPKDKLLANLEGKFYTFESGDYVPYLPNLKFSVDYEREIISKFDAGIGIVFASKRYCDIANKVELDPYFDLRINADYRINDSVKLYMMGENLLNQNIYLHNNYKLWGLFIKGGVVWQF
jgi:hypothetical protein